MIAMSASSVEQTGATETEIGATMVVTGAPVISGAVCLSISMMDTITVIADGYAVAPKQLEAAIGGSVIANAAKTINWNDLL